MVALLLLAPAPARAGYDRAAIEAGFCGGGAAEAGQRVLAGLAEAEADDLTWARGFVVAAQDRKVPCPAGASPLLNLRSRATYEFAAALLTLLAAPTPEARAVALPVLARRAEAIPAGLLDRAAHTEQDPELRAGIEELRVTADINAPDIARRIVAVQRLAANPTTRAATRLAALQADPAYAADAGFRAAVDAAMATVRRGILFGQVLTVLYNGLSFGSILFMAAVGLAVIFGLMGVINLAQGEFIMLGAYVTWLVQQAVRAVAPGLLEWYLPIAILPAFLVTAAIGAALESGVVRHLYKRPLMTLLATWAVSLFLSNLVRVVFGTQNLQFETPFYARGGVQVLGDFIVTWNRLGSILMAAATLALIWLLLRRTPFGLNLRAVTQNRGMADCIGIDTRRVDILAFALGSGLAGLAGLVLSQLYSVNPLMGTNFTIDSFMVVALGGVASLPGTVVAALGIGLLNVVIEPLYGAVAAKVIVLLGVIAFLQWRTEGLFSVAMRRR